LLAGAAPWMIENLAPGLEQVVRSIATVFGIGLVLHLALGVPVGLLRVAIGKLVR